MISYSQVHRHAERNGRLLACLGLGAWFLLNDWIDFGPLQTHPGLPPGVSAVIMMGVTVGLTVLLTLIYLWIAGRSGYIGRQELNRPSVKQ